MPEEAPREATILGKDRERVGPLSTPVTLSPEKSTLKKDQVHQQEREHLETEPGEKLRQPNTLEEVATLPEVHPGAVRAAPFPSSPQTAAVAHAGPWGPGPSQAFPIPAS